MTPVSVTVGSATFSQWVPVNWPAQNLQIALGVSLAEGSTLTYTVQHTFDNVWDRTQQFSISRTTTTATVTKVNHKLAVGDWVKVSGGGAPLDGEFTVASVPSADTFTYTVANSGATSLPVGKGYITTARVFPHSSLVDKTTLADGNYAFPPRACRLIVTAYTDGNATLTVVQR